MNYNLIIMLFIGLLIYFKFTFRQFMDVYFNVIVVIATISLIGYISAFFVSPIGDIISGNGTIYNNYYGVYYQIQGTQRNLAIFWEPGVYQVYLNIALIYSLFKRKKHPCSLGNIILFVTIITTMSTIGYVAMGLIFIAYMLNNNKFNRHKRIIFGLGAIILICLISIYLERKYFGQQIITVLGKLNVAHSSYTARMDSFIVCTFTGFKYILAGVGMGNVYSKVMESSILLNKQLIHLTSTISILFSAYGITYAIIVFWGWIGFPRLFVKGIISSVILFSALFAILNNENLSLSLFMNIQFFYALGALYHRKKYKRWIISK